MLRYHDAVTCQIMTRTTTSMLQTGDLVVLRKRSHRRRLDGGRRRLMGRVQGVDATHMTVRPLARVAYEGPSQRLLFVDMPYDSQWTAYALVAAVAPIASR